MTNLEQDDWGDDGELRARLDAYAVARLRADPERTGRVRVRVMAAARAVEETRRAQVALSPLVPPHPVPAAPRRRVGLPFFRVPAAIAASLLLVGMLAAGAVLAGSGPGGPFYAARLWVEELTLPTDADARAEAQLARLEERLAEAAQAAAAGNGAAVTAALEAYRSTAEAALGSAGADPTRREHLAFELGRHVAVLEALVPRVPGQASEAIQAAIDRTETRIQEILATPPGSTPKPTPPGKPEATPALEATPKPTPPGKPEATPKATPPGKPEATPKLEATPKPTPPGPARTPPGKPEATPTPGAAPSP
jgi:hypothetical protein